jgi:hypothetical protein
LIIMTLLIHARPWEHTLTTPTSLKLQGKLELISLSFLVFSILHLWYSS